MTCCVQTFSNMVFGAVFIVMLPMFCLLVQPEKQYDDHIVDNHVYKMHRFTGFRTAEGAFLPK